MIDTLECLMLPFHRVGAPKHWKKGTYCVHGACRNNTSNGGVFIPFPKPCSAYLQGIVNPANRHNAKQCVQCIKVLRWIHLCKRADKKLQLHDITSKTYVCNKHFQDASGPTELNPDPFPANISEDAIIRARSRVRKQRAPREETDVSKLNIKKKKSGSLTITSSSLTARPAEDFAHADTVPASPSISSMQNLPKVILKTPNVSDHSYILTSNAKFNHLSHLKFKLLATALLENNLTVNFNPEEIYVAATEEITVKIDRLFKKHILVYKKEVQDCHPVWSQIEKTFLDNVPDFVSELKLLSEVWHVCESFRRAHIAALFQRTFQSDLSAYGDATSVRKSAKTCCILCRKQEVCKNCKKEHSRLKKRSARRARRGNCTAITVNIKYMSHEQAKECVKQLRQTLKLEKRKIQRLQIKIRDLMIGTGVHLGECENNDFDLVCKTG